MQPKLQVNFLGFHEPREWEMNGQKGKTYRINIMSGTEVGALKIPEEMYYGLRDSGVAVMDSIRIVYAPRFVLSVVNGRAVQDLKFQPETFELSEAAD